MRKNYLSWVMVSGVSVASVLALAGCQNMDAGNIGGVVQGVSMAAKATTLNDDELMEMANQSCAAMDAENKVAPPNSSYAKRLQKVTANMPGQIGKQKAVYKVYMTSSVNAWAMDNGCIRVYSGLMDLMNDDELRGVLGHEIGHVAMGHNKKRMQTAYATTALRTVAANSSNAAVASLSRSELGDVGHKFINAQFSQSQESDADDYSFDLLTEKKMERKGLVTGFEKLGKLSSKEHSMLDSHPASKDRAKRMQDRLNKK